MAVACLACATIAMTIAAENTRNAAIQRYHDLGHPADFTADEVPADDDNGEENE